MKILISKKQYDIIKEQSVVGAPNYGMSSEPIIQTRSQTPKINTNEKNLPYRSFTNEDTSVFKKILSGIGAPITPETLGFMYAWRECESSLGSEEKFFCNNPFNTTWDSDSEPLTKSGVKAGDKKSTMYKRTNPSGVKSYKSIDTGIDCTVKSILKNFPNISKTLQIPNISILQIAKKSPT